MEEEKEEEGEGVEYAGTRCVWKWKEEEWMGSMDGRVTSDEERE